MAKYNAELVDIILFEDPTRPISSGFSLPRPSAWHQAHCPLQGDCGPIAPGDQYWSNDSLEQWSTQFKAQQGGIDIWSIHVYDSETCYFPSQALLINDSTSGWPVLIWSPTSSITLPRNSTQSSS